MERDSREVMAVAERPRAAFQGGRGVATSGSESVIDKATHDIRNATGDVYDLAINLRDYLDGTLGSVPRPGGGNGSKQPESPVRAEQLSFSVEALHHAIAELREQVARVRQI